MGHEVKIRVVEERVGTAVRDAGRDLEGLRRQEAAEARKLAIRKDMEATVKRAGGDNAGAAALQAEAQVLKRSAGIQRDLLTTRGEAMALAQQQIAAERQIADQAQARQRSEQVAAEELAEHARARALAQQVAARQTAAEAEEARAFRDARPAPVIHDYAAEDAARRLAEQDAHVAAYRANLRDQIAGPSDEHMKAREAFLAGQAGLHQDSHVGDQRRFLRGQAGDEQDAHVAYRDAVMKGVSGEKMDAHVQALGEHQEQKKAEEVRALYADQLKAIELRAAGNKKEAEALERSNAIRARAIDLERKLGIERGQAVSLATREVDAHRKIAAAQASGQLGASLLTGGLAVAGTIFEDYSERRGIENRDRAARAMAAREAALHGERGYSSGEATGAFRGTEDALAQRQIDRVELERKAKDGWIMGALKGAAVGAGTGFIGGSFAPGIGNLVGAGIGAVTGGIAGGVNANLSGRRSLKEDDAARKRDEELLALQKKTQADYIAREVTPMIDASEKSAHYDMAGARALHDQVEYHKEIERLKKAGITDDKELLRGADALMENRLRDRVGNFAGLINARTGAAASARIATLAHEQLQTQRDSVKAYHIEAQNRLMEQHHQAEMAQQKVKDFTER